MYPLEASELGSFFELSLDELMKVEITTTSKFKERINDSPANIYVFNREQIMQRGYRNVEDLLQAIPGVDLQKYSAPFLNVVSVRGIVGNNKFLILQDGVRLNSPTGVITAIGNNYPLYYAKKVEVLMGPASVVYGADAFMGVINIITMDGENKNNTEISLTAGTDGYGYAYTHLHQNFNPESNLNVGLQGFNSQEYRFAEDFPELYNISGKSYKFADTREFQFYVNYRLNAHWQFGLNHATHSNSEDFTLKPSRSQFDVNATEKINQTTLFGRFTTEISSDIQSSTLLTLMNYELDNSSYFNNFFTGGVPGYKYANSNRVSINQDIEYNINEKHLFSGGLVYDYFDTIPKGADLTSPYDSSKGADNQNQFYANTTLPIQFFENKYHNVGIYAQDNWQINDKWRLVTGLRLDDNSFYGSTTNPRISLIHKYDEHNLFKLLYGHAFLAPAPDQAFNSFGSFTGTQNGNGEWISSPARFQVPNPDLKPERVKTLEFNYEYWFNKDTHLKVAPFINRISDVILNKGDEVADQAIPGADLQRTSKFDNVGKSESYGFDVSINNQISSGTVQFKNWGYFSFTDGYLINQGNKTELPMMSRYKLGMGSIIIYHKDYILTPKISWIGTTNSRQPDPVDKSKMKHVPSYFLMDLHGEVKVTGTFTVKFDIYNLFDKMLVNAPFMNAFLASSQAPQPGRLSTLTLNIQF